ncbi:MAG: hypothetical protein NCW75_14545 [Phycisphaera sp.]|nr:MAG: hypothetical protein NCW75_14545 [Phycisphaera sp.]
MTRSLAILVLLLGATFAGGCNILGFAGALEEQRRRTGKVWVDGVYNGLEDQKVAVVVDASNDIYATGGEEVVGAVLVEVIARLVANAEAESVVPAADIMRVLYDEPDLLDRTYDEVAARLGVDRLIVIQLDEFRLAEPGNQYVWSGQAAGNLLVIEADSYIEDDVRLEQYVNVTYPDRANTTIDDLTAQVVALELLRRFANRSSWFFYRHQERYPGYQEY